MKRALNRRAAGTLFLSLSLVLGASAFAADKVKNPGSVSAQVQKGNEVYQKWCAPCHAAGPGHPGTTAIAALYKGAKPAALEDRTDLSPEIVKHFVRTGVSVMPFFRKTEISDVELDALGAYLARKR